MYLGDWRDLSPGEVNLIDRLLAAEDVYGRPELLRQAKILQARTFDDGSGFELRVIADAGPSPSDWPVPVSGQFDEDGVPGEVLLHTIDGYLSSVEMFRHDGIPPTDSNYSWELREIFAYTPRPRSDGGSETRTSGLQGVS